MTLEHWRDKLKPAAAPIFRHTQQRLRELSPRREEIAARDVAGVLLYDPLATLHILHAINLRVLERYGTEVMTVEHALMMQGLGVYLDAARRLPVLEDSPAGRDHAAFLGLQAVVRRAQHAAWQARDFAVQHTDVRAEEVEVAALLAYAAECLLWLRAPATAVALKRARRRLAAPDAEISVLGVSMRQLGLAVLEDWSIPPGTRDLLQPRFAERPRQTIIAACIDIAERSERGWWDDAFIPDYVALAGVENTPLELVIATVHANAARVARNTAWLHASPAAAWMPMLPGPWPPDEYDAEPAAPAARPAPVAPPPHQDAPAAAADDAHAVCPMPDKAVLRATLQGIEGHLDGSLTLNQMSALILKGLHTGLGLSRILFAMVTPDGRRVKSRFTLGVKAEDPLRQFEFSLDGKDLFCQLMGKMQGVWVNADNRDRLWPMIAPHLQTMIGVGEFYAMSLHVDHQPLGLIYADRGHGACGLDPLTYTDFKMLCLQAARGLGRIKAPRA